VRELDMSRVTPEGQMTGDDPDETAELQRMLRRAQSYVEHFPWCPTIMEKYLGVGIGGVLSLFLFRFSRQIGDGNDWLWVVVGDLPSAYIAVAEAPDPASALESYCELMEGWAIAVRNGSSLADVFQVDAAPTEEHAQMLLSRTKFIRDEVVPECQRSRQPWGHPEI
jgi:hypothetical protein